MKRKIEITFEMEELVFYKTRRSVTAFCPHCQTPVEIVAIENSDSIETEKFYLSEDAEIHFLEAEKK